jgi:hypothetical protein
MNPLHSKPNVVQAYQVVLYSRALHPELFPLRGRTVVRHGAYELEAWVMPGQHLLRFEHKAQCVTELVTDQDKSVPNQGIVTAFLCGGERDYDHDFPKQGLRYMTTVQTENLSDNLYHSTYEELLDLARQSRGLAHRWTDESGKCLSLVDIQHMTREVHIQTYHMIATSGLVLRTQTIFEHK